MTVGLTLDKMAQACTLHGQGPSRVHSDLHSLRQRILNNTQVKATCPPPPLESRQIFFFSCFFIMYFGYLL
jgi:hypothetical protein